MKIKMNDSRLSFMGRIDFKVPESPVFIYAGSMVKIKIKGTSLLLRVKNLHNWNDNYLGVVIDQKYVNRIYLNESNEILRYTVAEHLEDKEHEIILYKCQDSVHYFQAEGLETDGIFQQSQKFPDRRMEFYGDSITAGACCEAHAYIGKEDPESTGEYCNAWYAYSMITARMLNAGIHNVAQGGIALFNGTGYFELDTGTRGMEDVYNKLSYVTPFGISDWNFNNYIPHVVVVAIGQNDNFPDKEKEKDAVYLNRWKKGYLELLQKLRDYYPHATIICITTLLKHSNVWDEMIEEACRDADDSNISKYTFRRNGNATEGHLRISEAYEMADELTAYIESLGEAIWSI